MSTVPGQTERASSIRRGVYPGSFNPPTTAHLAIAEAARSTHRLARVDLVMSKRALDKEHVERPTLEHRLSVLRDIAAGRPWLGVVVTEHQLLVDIADGYDVLVVGADKWGQLLDPRYYGSIGARDDALARLPTIAVAPRPPHPAPAELLLDVDDTFHSVSSTAVRNGEVLHMLAEAAAFDRRTGAWSDPERYERWLAAGGGC
ncbi:MAG: hypothetical protein OEY23_25255 [Acidimicrobiia bacterium]|nr:hypothetical protein [Acidimicrobiia bacterium]